MQRQKGVQFDLKGTGTFKQIIRSYLKLISGLASTLLVLLLPLKTDKKESKKSIYTCGSNLNVEERNINENCDCKLVHLELQKLK